MKTCWAACLGNCSDKISGEHLVSAGMFDDDQVRVQGLSWCLHEPKKIGLSSLVKNVLCTNHNSQLSPVDEAGISARNNLKEAFRLHQVRSNARVGRWTKSRFEVDGINLERWFLKTLITLSFGGPLPVGAQSRDSETPYQRLVEVCFGVTQFQPRAGLYMFGEVGRSFNVEDKLTIITFRDVNNTFNAGATFFVYGFEFILFLDENGLHPQNINFVHKDGVKEQRHQPIYRPKYMNFQIGKHVSHTIKFSW
jgi:hypothetical protein